ncbi:MAG: Stk1 family PASTA domain-containing Ser/Thr kinase [Eubacteriales bacterium]|nr:Stk1 family PASTA domain-containing Ser/Thr kinase [Eubacteriales bacterium]
MSDCLGKTLGGRYEVREVIGTGGMAVVYKAYDTVLHRFVAIKILKEEFAADNEFRKRFNNEAQAVAKLSHNNIVSIYDVSQDHSEAEYIVMELCEGVTLKDYLRKKHHLSWQETVYFAQQVARALDHAHSRGIIHQDIKPQNIMLLRDGTAKVMDFGIASFANSQETKKVSEAIGSVHYISPEQAKGIKVDYRTDLYSLGVVMYEMLTGTMPFRGDTAVAVVMQHINTVPPKPSELVPNIPPAMNEIVMHAMCANAAQRYGSAMELLNDLERIRSNPNLYLNYTNRASSATQAIRYDDEEQVTQLIRGIPEAIDANDGYEGYAEDEDDAYEYDSPRQKKSSSGKGVLALGLIALVAVAVFALWAVLSGGANVKLTVPEFVGMNYYDEIEGTKYEKQFEIKVEKAAIENEDDYDDGEVMMQDPEEGTKVDRGTKVSLVIASLDGEAEDIPDEEELEEPEEEEELVSIPSVSGDSYDDAASALKALGLKVSREEENSDSVEKDHVISSSPSSGEEVKKGSTVVLTVSTGPKEEKVSVPSLSGMTQNQAAAALKKVGLSLGSVSQEESDEPTGTVIGQSVSAGSEVNKGSSVDITLAAEPPEYEPEEPVEEETPSGSVGFTKDGGTTYINVSLPSDRDSVNVRVSVAGNALYDSAVNCNRSSFTVHASYSGTERVQVTMDGTTIYDGDYDFGA